MGDRVKWLVMVLLILAGTESLQAQTVVKGIVRDAVTKRPLPFVSVYFKGSKGAVSSDDGSYTLSTQNTRLGVVTFSYVGYTVITKSVMPGKEQEINVELEPAPMAEVVVTTNKRGKYRNKDNPAVELIRKVIEHKSSNRTSSYDYVQYQQYEKMELSLTNKPEKMMNNRLLKQYKFVLENQDTTKVEGKALLPVYLEETLSEKFFVKIQGKKKHIYWDRRK